MTQLKLWSAHGYNLQSFIRLLISAAGLPITFSVILLLRDSHGIDNFLNHVVQVHQERSST